MNPEPRETGAAQKTSAGRAPNAHDVAQHIAEALKRLFRATKQKPLRAIVRAAHDDAERRNVGALRAQPAACRAGCAFCCHQQVSATAAEILVIAQRIEAQEPAKRARMRLAVAKAEEKGRGLDPMQRWAQRAPCPLLGPDKLCSVYEDRPFGCRGYVSLDVSACEGAFAASDASSPVQIPRSEPVRLNAIMLSYALERALHGLGLPHFVYDLNHGLTIALQMGARAAIARFLAGEDVLAPAQFQRPRATVAPRQP